MSDLLLRAEAWAAADVEPRDAAELRALIAAGESPELKDRFTGVLEFGTAGLRGVLGAGPNRMNRAVVVRTTAGLARYLQATVPDLVKHGVVLGRDGRRGSDVFTEDAAAVLAAHGVKALVLPGLSPTPLTAFAVKHLGAVAGVMVTASHNPPEYNGYKVYWGNGAQIVPPHDGGIAKAIEPVEAAKDVPRMSAAEARSKGLRVDLDESTEREYLKGVDALRVFKTHGPLRIVYTAMHGVGGPPVMKAMANAGFTDVIPVPAQFEPDGAFPTVKFPNPEEPGAMDLSTALAKQNDADLVLANDPDADRLAVMAKNARGEFEMFSGNEVGVLLGHYLLTQKKTASPLVITTIVSSAQLGAIAASLGAAYEETLTGFKWIANRAMEKDPDGTRFVMGYEEAIGYSVGPLVRDKDGVGTAVVVADMAAWCKARGATLWSYLEEIRRAHGLFLSRQLNFTLKGADGAATIAKVMTGFRTRGLKELAGLKVDAISDYEQRLKFGGGAVTPITLPRSNVIAFHFKGGSRVTLRPSGTEPKVKFYVEVCHALAAGQTMDAARTAAQTLLETLCRALVAEAVDRGLPT